MAAVTLFSLFPEPEDVLTLTPEDFAGVIIELMPRSPKAFWFPIRDSRRPDSTYRRAAHKA